MILRLAILGNSGSGKSTLAQRIGILSGLAPLDLDTLAWEPGRIAVPRDPAAARADVEAYCSSHTQWIIEGCYADLITTALPHEPVLVFLEPGLETCLAHCRRRPWEPHKYRSKAEQDEHLAFLLEWVEGYYTRDGEMSRRAHQALFDRYQGQKHQLKASPDPEFIEALLSHARDGS